MDTSDFVQEGLDFLPEFIRINRWFNQSVGFDDSCTLPPTQMQALIVLIKYPTLNKTQLADYLFMPRQQLTKVIDKLVGNGLVERKADPGNRRVVLISLSPEGQAYLVSLIQNAQSRWAKLTSLFTGAQMIKMNMAFRLIKEVIAEIPEVGAR